MTKAAGQPRRAGHHLQGRRNSMQYAFAVHQLGHAHRVLVHGAAIDPNTLPGENLRQHYLRREERKKAQKAAE